MDPKHAKIPSRVEILYKPDQIVMGSKKKETQITLEFLYISTSTAATPVFWNH